MPRRPTWPWRRRCKRSVIQGPAFGGGTLRGIVSAQRREGSCAPFLDRAHCTRSLMPGQAANARKAAVIFGRDFTGSGGELVPEIAVETLATPTSPEGGALGRTGACAAQENAAGPKLIRHIHCAGTGRGDWGPGPFTVEVVPLHVALPLLPRYASGHDRSARGDAYPRQPGRRYRRRDGPWVVRQWAG